MSIIQYFHRAKLNFVTCMGRWKFKLIFSGQWYYGSEFYQGTLWDGFAQDAETGCSQCTLVSSWNNKTTSLRSFPFILQKKKSERIGTIDFHLVTKNIFLYLYIIYIPLLLHQNKVFFKQQIIQIVTLHFLIYTFYVLTMGMRKSRLRIFLS